MKRSAKGKASQVVTANDLITGAVVFRTAAGSWSRSIGDALVADEHEAAEATLADALADVERHIVVEAYLVDVRREGANAVPLLLREAIRAAGGPTITENRTPADRGAAA